MFNFRSTKTDTTYGVLIDISSGTVGVAIVVSTPEKKLPEILFTHRVTMRVVPHNTQKTDHIRRIREALLSAALVLSQEGYRVLNEHNPHARISKIYLTCSAPWSYTIARNVHYEDDTPFKITESIITDLVQSAESEIVEYLQKNVFQTTRDFTIVERATVDIHINEYPITHPIGLKGSIIELSHVAGVIPNEIIDAVHEVQDKLFPHTTLHMHSYMFVMYCVSRELFAQSTARCLIDITGEAVEFGVVENKLLMENASIPFGSNSFIRDVMDHTQKPVSDIQTHIAEFSEEGGIDFSDLKNDIEQYIQYIQQALEDIHMRKVLPKEIVLTVHAPYRALFTHILTEALARVSDTQHYILTVDEYVHELTENKTTDVYLALSAGFFHKLHSYHEPIEK